jgi:hypothetical protein
MNLLNQPIEISTRTTEISQLERRLDDGYARIEQARLDGIDTTAWEEFWVKLLVEYQSICDELTEAA